MTSLFGDDRIEIPVVDPADRPAELAALAAEVAVCKRCPQLAATRTQTVFGTGSPTARLMFVGEAPGAEEDRTGEPFVGRAGQLLTDMITKGMGLTRAEVYIANILKSRPPDNRNPLPEEICQLPPLPRTPDRHHPSRVPLPPRRHRRPGAAPDRRARWAGSAAAGTAIAAYPTVVTYHPSYLLRNPAAKKDAWEDLQMLMLPMGLKPPPRKKGS